MFRLLKWVLREYVGMRRKHVMVTASELHLRSFRINEYIRRGCIYTVREEYIAQTRKGSPMYVLDGAFGGKIMWRNKVMQEWCRTMSTREWLKWRFYDLPRQTHVL